MGTARGADRLVTFNDAIVAIAITLLILPLVDAASEIGSTPVGDFLKDNQQQFVAFFVSWIVIATFWRIQHSMLEVLEGYTEALRNVMLVWMLAIVFLPFPTALIASVEHGSVAANAIYIGTMLVASLAMLGERWIINSHPELAGKSQQAEAARLAGAQTPALFALALLIAVVFPSVGLWSLFVLFLDPLIERFIPAFSG
ncbi:MAG: TMEM175 family protein [Solirubrobacterales bacterium]